VRVGDWRFGLKIVLLFVAVMLPILWFASADPSFRQVYPHAEIVKTNWSYFLIYEAFFFLYFTGWEFIWRGYMLFGLEKRFGAVNAVLIQTLPFVILHFGKPFAESFGAIVAGIALGALALRTRSYWYCVVTHWLVMLSIDLLATFRTRTGIEGTGVADLVSMIGRIFGY
jgi:membrane protease YdiL (CAAX protease family)